MIKTARAFTKLLGLTTFLFSFAPPAHANTHHEVGALCITLDVQRAIDNAAYFVFLKEVCGHYSNNLVILQKITHNFRDPSNILNPVDTKKIKDFLSKNKTVDIFIAGHTNNSAHWFVDLFFGDLRGKVRLVYNSGCFDGSEYSDWTTGWKRVAKTLVAHIGLNYGIPYMPVFTHDYFSGTTIEQATQHGNEVVKKHLKLLAKIQPLDGDPNGHCHGDCQAKFK